MVSTPLKPEGREEGGKEEDNNELESKVAVLFVLVVQYEFERMESETSGSCATYLQEERSGVQSVQGGGKDEGERTRPPETR